LLLSCLDGLLKLPGRALKKIHDETKCHLGDDIVGNSKALAEKENLKLTGT